MTTESILFHIIKPDMLPVGIKYEALRDIDNYKDGSINNILLQDILDYMPYDKVIPLVELCIKKLAIGGTISLQGVDLKQLASSITFNEIGLDIAKKILYNNKQSIHTMEDIIKILSAIGCNITSKKYINIFEYYIEAQYNDKN